jgi:hypothetical protein
MKPPALAVMSWLVTVAVAGFLYAAGAWYAVRRFGSLGLIATWVGASAVFAALMMLPVHVDLAQPRLAPYASKLPPLFIPFFAIWLTALGAASLSLKQRSADPTARFSLPIGGRAILAAYGAMLVTVGLFAVLYMPGMFHSF